jgi:hypothetical protein
MRRAFGFTGAWLMTTVVAMGVSWLGCAIVLNGAAAPAPSVTAELQAVDPTQATLTPPAATSSYPAPQSAGRGRALPPPRTSTPPRVSRSTPRPRTTGLPDEIPIRTLHSKPPAEPVAPPAPSITPVPEGSPQPAAQVELVSTPAGDAWIGFSPDGVLVFSLQPDEGYEWHIAQEEPGALLIVLTQPGHEYDLYAAWNGAPDASITEYRW